ncbi:hypothetical protein ERJ75_000990400 [Trypanosoma vivax]|nr:hypothetical protein ERJ75_000990400 [Trypanosoma vivax]
MDQTNEPNAQRETVTAHQMTAGDGADPRFAECVQAAVFVEHSVELAFHGGHPDWNCVLRECARRGE